MALSCAAPPPPGSPGSPLKPFSNPTWLDELGIHLSLPRFSGETFSSYKDRLLLQARNPPDYAEEGFIRSVNRLVALVEEEIFRIEPIVDAEGTPVAPDIYIEIDEVFLRVWSDYENGVMDLEVDIYNRDGAYFLGDLATSLNNLAFLYTGVVTNNDWEYLRSWNLTYGNSHRHFDVPFLKPTRMNDLPHRHIKNIKFYNPLLVVNEVANSEALVAEGDYYIDYVNGIVFTYEMATGGVSYSYRGLPYSLIWQPVKIMPINGKSMEHITKDYLVNPDGQNERLLLNSYGAQIANETLAIHPLQWGK